MASGEVSHSINAASGWSPIGTTGIIEECEGNSIRRISGVSAQTFMKEQLGKPLGEADLGLIPLSTYPSEGPGCFSLRTPSHLDPHTGAINLFGSIDQGTSVRVCTATREEVIKGVSIAVEGLNLEKAEGIAAVVISCAGRKWLLEDQGKGEVERILATLGRKIPLVGFPSFGEIGPFRKPDGTYTGTFFHNVTFVVCTIGGEGELLPSVTRGKSTSRIYLQALSFKARRPIQTVRPVLPFPRDGGASPEGDGGIHCRDHRHRFRCLPMG